ncbi:LysR family transcriptional regulator [Paenirhodobacter sp.]|uniref:LysR family transcriptional regulator n=1 Tax=Paenirhodobacter sp. TaxID=1965326 RepID=UPI003B3C0B9B
MNIRFMETVICLANLRSFRATAEHMHITPAAISSRIMAIENEMGIKLFDRDSKDVRITPQGEAFVQSAVRIVQEYRVLTDGFAQGGDTTGQIRLGVVPSVAPSLLPRVIRILRTDYPRLAVSLVTDSGTRLLEMLDASELDVVLGIKREDNPARQSVPFWTLGMYWVARTGMFPAGARLHPADLLSCPVIAYERGSLNHQRIEDYFGEIFHGEGIAHYSNSLGTTINLIEAGIGVSVLPPIVVQEQLRTGRLTVLDVQPVFPPTAYHVIWLRNSVSRMPQLIAEVTRRSAAEVAKDYSRDLVIPV